MALDNFERLEEGLVRLLSAYESLAAENREIREAMASKDKEISELKQRLGRLDSERGEVREKVDGLLERLESLLQGA